MSRSRYVRSGSFIVGNGQPVIAIPLVVDGQGVERFSTEIASVANPESVQAVLDLAGAWTDLDWDETVATLDRIRHENRPTPPIDSIEW